MEGLVQAGKWECDERDPLNNILWGMIARRLSDIIAVVAMEIAIWAFWSNWLFWQHKYLTSKLIKDNARK